jgi:WD40 repeat protein
MKARVLLLSLCLIAVGCNKNLTSLPDKAASALAQLAEPSPAAETSKRVENAQFSPDGERIVVRSQDGTARIWDAQTSQLLSSTNGPKVQVWDATTGRAVPPRYQPNRPDNMPMIGPDNFQRLQDQIDALERRVQELEKKAKK